MVECFQVIFNLYLLVVIAMGLLAPVLASFYIVFTGFSALVKKGTLNFLCLLVFVTFSLGMSWSSRSQFGDLWFLVIMISYLYLQAYCWLFLPLKIFVLRDEKGRKFGRYLTNISMLPAFIISFCAVILLCLNTLSLFNDYSG